MVAPTELINYERYPIDEYLANPKHSDMILWRKRYREQGVCVLEDFLAPNLKEQFIGESNSLVGVKYHNTLIGNAYLENAPPDLPSDHARALTDRTALGVVAYDQMPETMLMRQLYKWDQFSKLICSILKVKQLYEYACPLGKVNISVMEQGDYLRWHFDQSDFVVSIHLQNAESGGDFEFVHNLRSDKTPNFRGVKKVLLGDRTKVQVLETNPGALILFRGRNTLHRVTQIAGSTPRLVALLSYAERPDVTSTEYLRQIRYGRCD